MYGYRRTRLDLDADSHECFRYFALLRGVPVGGAMRQVLARYAESVEKEFPSIRAHMLAWREAHEAERASTGDPSPYDVMLDQVPF